jgi:hypothetical protein
MKVYFIRMAMLINELSCSECNAEHASIDNCIAAARCGHIKCLQFAYANGSPLYDQYYNTCLIAISNNHFDCLIFAHSHGCPLNARMAQLAAAYEDSWMLRYLYENNCPVDSSASSNAASNGRLQCLQFLIEHKCQVSDDICITAACYDRFDCLRYLINQGYPAYTNITQEAARYNSIDCLRFLHENGYRWPSGFCAELLEEMDAFECFRYAVEHGATIDNIDFEPYENYFINYVPSNMVFYEHNSHNERIDFKSYDDYLANSVHPTTADNRSAVLFQAYLTYMGRIRSIGQNEILKKRSLISRVLASFANIHYDYAAIVVEFAFGF